MRRTPSSRLFSLPIFFLLSACLILSSCESVIRAKVETFRDTNAGLPTGTIVVRSGDEALNDSLEFKHYRDRLAQRLQEVGYTVQKEGPSEYLATLAYAVSRQEKDRPSSRVVLGGHFGYYSHYPRGSILITDFNGQEFEYVREVSLSIARSDSGSTSDTASSNTTKPAEAKPITIKPINKKILEMRATSVGHCKHLTVVYDEMLHAIFSNMNRSNGSIDSVKVKGELRCP
ncbi:MAG: hypothetical protein K6L76_00050 [Agarilytica sp.]